MTQKEIISTIINVQAKQNILNAMNKLGIEGTEDTIKGIYKHLPKAKELMLKNYKEMLCSNQGK